MITTVCSMVAAAALAAASAPAGPVLYIDDQTQPAFTIAWTTADGERIEMEGSLPYAAPEQRQYLGHNIEAFAAVGGTRLTKGAGRPSGSILRVGFYKKDTGELFFEDIAEGSSVHVTMTGVRFARPGAPVPETALQHLKYSLEDVQECGLTGDAMDQYNTFDAGDTMNGKITPENARLGSLDGVVEAAPAGAGAGGAAGGANGAPAQHDMPGAAPEARAATPAPASLEGLTEIWLEEDGSVSLRAEIPYAMFRHVRDPWMRTDPGGFFEPYHFHIEFEAIPVEVWEEEFEGRPLPRRADGAEPPDAAPAGA